MSRQHRADWMLVLATFFWGASNCLMSICLEDMQPLTLNAFRFITAFLVLGIVLRRRVLRVNRATIKYAVLIGVCLVFIYLGATYGILYTSVSNAGFIGALTVLFTPLFEFALFHKKPGKKLGFCLLICFFGMAMLTLGDALRPALGDILCLAVPTFYAIDLMITEHAVAKPEVDPIALGVWQLSVIGVVMLILSLAFEQPHLPTSPKIWIAGLFLGIFCSGVCFVIQSVEQQYTTASRASLIFTLEPVFSAVLAFFLLGERPHIRGYLGAVLMMASLVIMEIDFGSRGKANDNI